MRFSCHRALLAASLAFGVSAAAHATTVWDESVNGDFSNSGLTPTGPADGFPAFCNGGNVVLGTTGNSGAGVDRDYFTFTIPVGGTLTAINVLPNTTAAGVSFIGLQTGPIMTVGPNGENAQNLLGNTHYGTDQIGQNLLTAFMHLPSLPGGAYTVWIQELGQGVEYGFDFVVDAPVPLPGAALLLVSGLGGLAALRRRRAGVAVSAA